MMNYQQKSSQFNVLGNHNKMKYNNNNNHKISALHKPYVGHHDVYNNNYYNGKSTQQQQSYRSNAAKFMPQPEQQPQQQQQQQQGVLTSSKNIKDAANNENSKNKTQENDNEHEVETLNEENNHENAHVPEDEEKDCNEKKDTNTDDTGDNNNNILSNEDESVSKNGKEKTPMCLVNELARFNKITHQYRLTSEKGPAHCKRFTVTLKLGEEEYSADGFKIKKAQHMAAAQAIEQTKYKHPVRKTLRRNEEGNNTRSNITPTVELNALAMKLGQQTYYLFDPRQMPHQAAGVTSNMNDIMHEVNSSIVPNIHPAHYGSHQHAVMPHGTTYIRRPGAGFVPAPAPFLPHFQPRFGYGRGYMQKYAPRFQPPTIPPPPPQLPMGPHGHAPPHYHPSIYDGGLIGMGPCKITLIVGTDKFVGTGRTLQQAKHDAAAQALQVLKAQQATQQEEALNNSVVESDDKKSPISLVHEIGIKRDLAVRFKVLREEGPAHMRKYVTACMVGTIVTEGDGNGKKISKKRAAEKMLVELKKLPPLSPPKSPTRRIRVKTPGKFSLGAIAITTPKSEKRKRVFVKEKSLDDSMAEEENPVTKLLQEQQARKAAEPVFEIIAKNGSEFARRKEFIVEVTFMNMVARGVGINKKLAKRNAAQNMLDLLAEVNTEDKEDTLKVISAEKDTKDAEAATTKHEEKEQIMETRLTAAATTETTTKADTFNLPMVDTTAGQIPGILILRPNKKNHLKKKTSANNSTSNSIETTTTTNSNESNENVPYKTTTTTQDETTATVTLEGATTTTTTTSAADNTDSNSVENNNSKPGKNASVGSIMKEQLLYLSKLMGFEVCFNDYPKGGSHSDFLTIVTLSTDPPQICHGTGSNSEESQNDAARNALKILSELGLSSSKK